MSNAISIVIPVFNRAHLVGRTLESIRQQTAPAFDVILVDNGSSDGSPAVLESWRDANDSELRRVRVLSCTEPGAPSARNAGLAAVETPWVLFFDSDDEMLPRHIERVLAGIAAYPEAEVLGWNVDYANRGIKRFRTDSLEWNNLFEGNFASLRWAARTELVRRVGGWNPSARLWDDIELGARLIATNPKIRHLGQEISVRVFPQEESISTNHAGDYLERIEVPLSTIGSCLAPSRQVWTDYVRMIAAGNTARSAKGDAAVLAKARILRQQMLNRHRGLHRLLLGGVYHFRRLGGRGQNHILKLLLNR